MIARTRSEKVFDVIVHILLIIIGFIALYPIYYVCIASISDPKAIAHGQVVLWPVGINKNGYTKLLANVDVWRGYANSLFYMFVGTVINLAVTLPAAFALSRPSLPCKKLLNLFFVFTMYFSGGMIPLFMVNKSLGLINNVWVLWLPGALSVYNLLVAKSNFQNNIPESIYESVAIDGGSKFTCFFKFALPLSTASIAVITLYYALGHWNNYMTPMIYITDSKKQTLQVIIKQITSNVDASLMSDDLTGEAYRLQQERQLLKYSVVVVSALPMVLLYPLVQKYFVKGVMIGAVKG